MAAKPSHFKVSAVSNPRVKRGRKRKLPVRVPLQGQSNKASGTRYRNRSVASSGNFVARYEYESINLVKSPLDKNNYQVIRFSNKLTACLISTLPHSTTTTDLSKSTHSIVQDFNKNFIHLHSSRSRTSVENESKMDPAEMSLLDRAITFLWRSSGDSSGDTEMDRSTWETEDWTPKETVTRIEGTVQAETTSSKQKHFVISVCVKVGSLHDPDDLPGMAHLCEHCIFEGTSQYPNAFALLQDNSVLVNAFTGKEQTVYYAVADTLDKFRVVLSIFADMFHRPSLSKEIITQEIQSVDSETSIRQTNDSIRIYDLFTALAKPGHPLRRYHAGDESTLKKSSTSSAIRRWFKKYYHASNLILSIQGPILMAQLIHLTSEHFHKIPSRRITTFTPEPLEQLRSFGYPFPHECFNKLYKINPYEDLQWLAISWTTPGDYFWRQNHGTKPMTYLSYLFNQRGANSMYDYLRNQGFITDLTSSSSSSDPCNSYIQSRLYSSFALLFELTNSGIDNAYTIILVVYSFLKLFQRTGPKRRIFDEIRQICANNFHYDQDQASYKDCSNIGISLNIHEDEPSLALTAPSLLTKYDPDLLRSYLATLGPKNMNIMMVSKRFEREVTHVHPNILTEYSAFHLNPVLLKDIECTREFSFCPFDDDFPERNRYIIQDQDVCQSNKEPPEVDEGTRMRVTNFMAYLQTSGKASLTCSHQEPRGKGIPSTSLYTFMINSSNCPARSAGQSALINLWIELFNERIKSKYCSAFSAGMDVGATVTDSGIFIYLQGLSRLLPDIWLSILKEFLNFHVDPKCFDDFKGLLLRTYGNYSLDNMTFGNDLLLFITTKKHFTCLELKHGLQSGACPFTFFQWAQSMKRHFFNRTFYSNFKFDYNTVSYDNFLEGMSKFKTQMWICGQLFGCLSYLQMEVVAGSIARIPYDSLGLEHFQDVSLNLTCELPKGEKCLRLRSFSQKCHTSFILNCYQLGILEKSNQTVCSFIASSISNHIFSELRTKQQLGYLVWTTLVESHGVSSLQVCINFQADKYTPGYVDEKIDECFHTFYEENLKSEEAFGKIFKKYQAFLEKRASSGDEDLKFTKKRPYQNNDKNISCQIKETKVRVDDAPTLHASKVRAFYTASFPYKPFTELFTCTTEGNHGNAISFRKLSVQVRGYKRHRKSSPQKPMFEELKRQYYLKTIVAVAPPGNEQSSHKNSAGCHGEDENLLEVIYDYPEDLNEVEVEANPYFLTDVFKFKKQLSNINANSD